MTNDGLDAALAYLRKPSTIKQHCLQVRAQVGEASSQFSFDSSAFEKLAIDLKDFIQNSYPNLDVPYHSRLRHLKIPAWDMLADLDAHLKEMSAEEKLFSHIEVVLLSVLLDAGAGPKWSFKTESGTVLKRSEGLAAASFQLLAKGELSSSKAPFSVDAQALININESAFRRSFQVTLENPIVGLSGRVKLLRRLGQNLLKKWDVSRPEELRLGNIGLMFLAENDEELCAEQMLMTWLEAFSEIWEDGFHWQGQALGDVGVFTVVQGKHETDKLVPFHKISQWLIYSLVEVYERLGKKVTGVEKLTALAEYRNGGLLLDSGVLALKNSEQLKQEHGLRSPLVVEWRALTVSLFEELAVKVREMLNLSEVEFPMAKVLQGGTWQMGRDLAYKKRVDGEPPIQIKIDGTFF